MILSSLLIASQSALAAPTLPKVNTPLYEIERTYNPAIQVEKVKSSWSLMGCRVEELEVRGQDPVRLDTRTVSVSLYHPKRDPKSKVAVVILPPTGGVNVLDRGYANDLCAAGMTVALVSGWEHQLETSLEFDMHNNGALRALAATRHVVEFLSAKNFHSIGLLGTSIGAISGALVYGVDPRISAAALIVGSARFADVVAESNEAGAKKLREARMAQLGIPDIASYKEALRAAITIEPTDYLQLYPGRKALVISADDDLTVPTSYQTELAQILSAEHIALKGNHLTGIKDAFWKHRDDIRSFFQRSLDSGRI